jgi:hypothetical protein
MLEHIVCKHILNHFDKFNILTILQHGFRKGYSCASQLLITLHDLLKCYDDNNQVDIAILDFSKAFDTVPHQRLLGKLDFYGIDGPILNWISQFLTNRYQRVVVDGVYSSSVKVASGVPQGTVLGPLLFLAYINDLPQRVKSQVRLFADDCLLYRPIKSEADHVLLQQDLTELGKWADEWGMRFNAQKCYVLRICRKSNPSGWFYSMGDHILQQVKDSAYLGVNISEDLKWEPHISKITAKAQRSLGFIRRNLKHCPEKLRELAYFTLVRSLLDYCSVVWDPHLVKDIHQLETVQRRAARFVKQDYKWDSSVTNMIKDLGWDALQDRRKEARLIMFHKIVTGVVAVPADDYLIPGSTRTRSNTKHFRHLQTKTEAYRNSFFPRTIKDWNLLPKDLVLSETVETFKSHLRGPQRD